MIHTLDVYDSEGEFLETISFPQIGNDSRFIIESATGLEPVDAHILTGSYAGRDESYFQNTTMDPRNIIITLGYNPQADPGSTVESLRRALYRVFRPKAHVRLGFRDGGPTKWIFGYVESHQAAIFSKDPRTQVSIICPSPHFNSYNMTHTGVSGPSTAFDYEDGDVPSGFGLTVNFTSSATVTNVFINGYQHMRIGHAFSSGDTMLLSTTPGNKYLRRRRSGNVINILDSVQSGTFDMVIDPEGSFGVQTNGSANYELRYAPKYSGL